MATDSAYDIDVHTHWAALPRAWRDLGPEGRASPFQSDLFLTTWYDVFARDPAVQAAIVEVKRRGELVMLLPLILTKWRGMRQLTFADLGVSDNNAPLLGPLAPTSATDARDMWRAIRARLPAADVLSLERQPRAVRSRPNPFTLLLRARRSRQSAQPIVLTESWQDYIASRSKHFRKEQARLARVFERHANARFELVATPERAAIILPEMERLQRHRMRSLGLPYRLDEPDYATFYRQLARDGISSGNVVIGALLANDDELVAGLFGIALDDAVAFVRIAHAGGIWRNASPGRLVIEKTIEALHTRGMRSMDLSIGDYGYKENFGIRSEPLMDIFGSLSMRGWPTVLSRHTKAAVRENQLGHALLVLLGKS